MNDLDAMQWRRQRALWEEILGLKVRVTALENQGVRPSVSIELPRTIHDWFELIHSLNKFLVWVTPRFLLPAWGFIQSLWPWLQNTGIPFLRTWLGW
jgi:hypothetical protein